MFSFSSFLVGVLVSTPNSLILCDRPGVIGGICAVPGAFTRASAAREFRRVVLILLAFASSSGGEIRSHGVSPHRGIVSMFGRDLFDPLALTARWCRTVSRWA